MGGAVFINGGATDLEPDISDTAIVHRSRCRGAIVDSDAYRSSPVAVFSAAAVPANPEVVGGGNSQVVHGICWRIDCGDNIVGRIYGRVSGMGHVPLGSVAGRPGDGGALTKTCYCQARGYRAGSCRFETELHLVFDAWSCTSI